MKRWIILTAASFIALGITTGSAKASPGDTVALVETWYARYLGRPADPVGLRRFVRDVRAGIPVDAVEANFLAGPEYYIRNGSNSIGFVRGLYRDVLGDLYPTPAAVAYGVSRLENSGSRQTVALGMLQQARVAFAAPVTVVEPVRVVPTPVVVAPPVTVPAPVIVPARPVYYGPPYYRPGFYLRIRW